MTSPKTRHVACSLLVSYDSRDKGHVIDYHISFMFLFRSSCENMFSEQINKNRFNHNHKNTT